MKRYLIILIAGLFLASCQAPNEAEKSLEDLKSELSDKKNNLRELEQEINNLEAEISKKEPIQEKTTKAVTTYVVEQKDFKSFTELQGNIESKDAVMISSEMGGRITNLNIDEGDYVKKGQVVGSVDMETTKKSLQEIQTNLELAEQVFDRQKRLWDQNIGSEIQYLQAKNNKERLEKSLETLQSQLAKASIISPMSGYVDMMLLKEGETTGPGTPIASVINTSSVRAVIDVPENLIGKVRKGEKVKVIFPALGTERDARVSLVGRSINPANRTFKVEINLSNSNSVLKPNLLVLAKVNDKTIDDAISIPVELVQQDVSGTSYVYTVAEGEDGKYAQRNTVKTGISYDGNIVIESGITAGDEVIDIGARGLAENELIEIKNDQE